MATLKTTTLKKSTSPNMKILMETVLDNVKKSDSPTVADNMIEWGGYVISFSGETWKFSKPNDDTIHEGKFPSGLGHVSMGIRGNINPKLTPTKK